MDTTFACVCGREFAKDGSGCPVHGLKRFCPMSLDWHDQMVKREGRIDLCARCASVLAGEPVEVDEDMLRQVEAAVSYTAVPEMRIIENEPNAHEKATVEEFSLKSITLGYQLPDQDFIEVAFSDWYRTNEVQRHLRYRLYRLFANARGWLGALHAEVVHLREENANLRMDLAELRAEPEPEPIEPTTVNDLRLSARTYNVLAKHNIRLISDLVKMSRQDLLDLPNCGITSVKIIENELERLGLSLRSEDV